MYDGKDEHKRLDALQVFVRLAVYIHECFIIKIRAQVSPWYTDDITKDDREPLQTRGEHTLYCPLKAKHCGRTQRGPNCLPFQVFLCSYLSLPYMAWKGTESKAFDAFGGKRNYLQDENENDLSSVRKESGPKHFLLQKCSNPA